MDRLVSRARWKQLRGRLHRMWGRWTHDPYVQFLGELDMVEGKIEEYHARKHTAHSAAASRPWTTRSNHFAGRRRGDLIA